jgi:Ca2+-dependent lipid-binding protein
MLSRIPRAILVPANNPVEKPDPFAVATINGEQTKTTGVSKKNLNPYWNESFDLYAVHPRLASSG